MLTLGGGPAANVPEAEDEHIHDLRRQWEDMLRAFAMPDAPEPETRALDLRRELVELDLSELPSLGTEPSWTELVFGLTAEQGSSQGRYVAAPTAHLVPRSQHQLRLPDAVAITAVLAAMTALAGGAATALPGLGRLNRATPIG